MVFTVRLVRANTMDSYGRARQPKQARRHRGPGGDHRTKPHPGKLFLSVGMNLQLHCAYRGDELRSAALRFPNPLLGRTRPLLLRRDV